MSCRTGWTYLAVEKNNALRYMTLLQSSSYHITPVNYLLIFGFRARNKLEYMSDNSKKVSQFFMLECFVYTLIAGVVVYLLTTLCTYRH